MEVSKKVLIVDDDENSLMKCRSLLSLHGFECYAAGSGQDALDLLHRMNEDALPGCIVTDFDMPHMTGVEMVRYIKKIPRMEHIPVILLSGGMNYQLSLDLVRLGFKHGMHKLSLPVLPQILKGILEV